MDLAFYKLTDLGRKAVNVHPAMNSLMVQHMLPDYDEQNRRIICPTDRVVDVRSGLFEASLKLSADASVLLPRSTYATFGSSQSSRFFSGKDASPPKNTLVLDAPGGAWDFYTHIFALSSDGVVAISLMDELAMNQTTPTTTVYIFANGRIVNSMTGSTSCVCNCVECR